MSFKIFVVKLIVFIFLLFVSDRLAGIVLRSLYSHAGDKFERENYMRDKMNSELIIMGSSKAAHNYMPSIIGDSLNMTAYNCGQRGNGIIYSYGRLATIYKRYTPKIIIYDVIKSYDIEVNDNSRYLDFLKADYGHNSTVDSLFYALDKYSKYKMLLNCYQYNSTICDLLINSVLKNRERFQEDGYFPFKGAKSDFVPSIIVEEKDIINEHIEIDSMKVSYLDKLAKEKRKSCFLVFTISPSYKYTSPKDYSIVRDICNHYNIPLLDYNNDIRFIGKYDLFYDGSHLNEKGAKIYSSIVASDVKQLIK